MQDHRFDTSRAWICCKRSRELSSAQLLHTHFLHHITRQVYWRSLTVVFDHPSMHFWSFMGQIHSLLSFHSDTHINTCTMPLRGKQNGRKSRRGISLAGNTAVTRGGDVRRKCPRQTDISDGPGCSSLGFPLMSLLCLSKRLKLTNTHHLSAAPRLPVWNLNLVSSILVKETDRVSWFFFIFPLQ